MTTGAGRAVLAGLLVAACGDPDPVIPGELVGPNTRIDLTTMTLHVGPLSVERFLSIGTADPVDESHYYDPRGDAAAILAPIERAVGADGDVAILEGGTRLRLVPCAIETGVSCAQLEIDASAHRGAVQLQLALARPGGDPLYGTGDAPVRANVAGTVREMQLRIDTASESSLNETHVPVPLVLWPRSGVGMFVADDRPAAFDLAARDPGRVTATFTLPARGPYTIYLFSDQSPLELVRTYSKLTTLPAVPPRWAFAPQQWRNVWDSSAQVRLDADDMRARGIPGSVMWIDNPWQTAYNTFVVDETRLAGPQQLIADLTARGYKVVFWSTPYVGTTPVTQADHAEGRDREFFVTDDSGVVIDFPWQDGPGALVDFTRPGATEWWRERIARVTAIGAAGFKLDFGEEVVTDIGGSILTMLLAAGDNSVMHRRYAEHYHRAYLGALPPGEGFLITRAGAWGSQAVNPTVWPGDLDSDFSEHGVDNGEGQTNVGGLPSALSRGLGLSVSGFPFYGSDIGGFRDFPTTEALLRWAGYAAFGTIMQLGGGGPSHNPWDTTLFDPGAEAIYRAFAEEHMRLNPLLWTLALRAGTDGTPVTVPARFAHDCACDDATFLLGDAILVAPVITEGATTRTVVLPPGTWFDVATGTPTTSDGTTSVTVPAPLGVVPRWQRAGSFVPAFARVADTLLPVTVAGLTTYADRALGRELRVHYVPYADASTARVELHDGAVVTGSGTQITVQAGSEYDVITVDIDGRALAAPFSAPAAIALDGGDLPTANDVATCGPPGCWKHTAATKRTEIRVFATAAPGVLSLR